MDPFTADYFFCVVNIACCENFILAHIGLVSFIILNATRFFKLK